MAGTGEYRQSIGSYTYRAGGWSGVESTYGNNYYGTRNVDSRAELSRRERIREKREEQGNQFVSIIKSLGSHISALALLIIMCTMPMLNNWKEAWAGRNPSNNTDIYEFYYNDTYEITLADGTTKEIEYYNPNICRLDIDVPNCVNESPYMEEVNDYETLPDIYHSDVSGVSGVDDFLSALNTAMNLGRSIINVIGKANEVIQEPFDRIQNTISGIGNWIKNMLPWANN